MEQIKIVLVDDKALYRDAIKLALKDFNILVEWEASNGVDLLEKLNINSTEIVLLDLSMPVLDGNKTFDIIKAKKYKARVIICTQFGEPELIKDYINRGACGFIEKNDSIEKMVTVIRAVARFFNNIKIIPESLTQKRHLKKKDGFYVLLFTKREKEIIKLIHYGLPIRAIAVALNISYKTVETILSNIRKKANIKNKTELSLYIERNGLNYLGNT